MLRIPDKIVAWFTTKSGVRRQGCVLAPDSFAMGVDWLLERTVGRGMNVLSTTKAIVISHITMPQFVLHSNHFAVQLRVWAVTKRDAHRIDALDQWCL